MASGARRILQARTGNRWTLVSESLDAMTSAWKAYRRNEGVPGYLDARVKGMLKKTCSNDKRTEAVKGSPASGDHLQSWARISSR